MKRVIGFTTKYYTLWEVSDPQLVHTSGGTFHKVYYQYIQNLSFDVDKARQKMVERYGDGNFSEDFDLRANRSFYLTTKVDVPNETIETKFQFGKYAGRDFNSVDDLNYKLWYVRAASDDKKPQNLINELVQSGQLFDMDGELVTPNELIERIHDAMDREVYVRDLFHTEGEKVKLQLRVRNVGGIDTRFGYMETVSMVDDSTNQIYMIKGTNPGLSVDDVVFLRGTVKWENYYSDWHNKKVITTILKRPKVLDYLYMSEETKERNMNYA